MVQGAGITEWLLVRGPIATEKHFPCQMLVACLPPIHQNKRKREPQPFPLGQVGVRYSVMEPASRLGAHLPCTKGVLLILITAATDPHNMCG